MKDEFNREISYLRVSITDKCNLRCKYCIPKDGVEILSHDNILRNEEFLYLFRIFVELGVNKIRFTGGEPLLRKGVMDILSRTRSLFPDIELCLTTNGVLLDSFLNDLYSNKIKKLNISLDAMSSEHYREIAGKDYFNRVILNIENALSYDYFDIKINTVLFEKTVIDLDELLEYFKDKNIILRFIERMPFNSTGQNKFSISSEGLIEILKTKGDLSRDVNFDTNVAIMYNYKYKKQYNMKVGIIPPLTRNFCQKCNRLRLTCDGFLRTCLHSSKEYNIKTPYRMDMGDQVIKDIILKAVKEKPEKHEIECYYHNNQVCSVVKGFQNRNMSKIGG